MNKYYEMKHFESDDDDDDVTTSSSSVNNTEDYILSVSWNENGTLAASYFSITTLQLHVMQQVIDLKPEFQILRNLLHQINGSIVLASGSQIFLKELMQLCQLPKTVKLNDYKIGHKNTVTSSDFVIYPNDIKTVSENRKRILSLRLPGMSTNLTEQERQLYIESLLPLNQIRVIESLGNLLNYLITNWKHLFMCTDSQPTINGLNLLQIGNHVQIDYETQCSLQIFSSIEHPSGYKSGEHGSKKEGFSLYSAMNLCSSRNGEKMLKLLLIQPICNPYELGKRFSIIQWCMNPENQEKLNIFKRYIKNINNSSEIYTRLIKYNGKPNDWKLFKKSVFMMYSLCKYCTQLIQTATTTSGETIEFIKEFAEFVNKNKILKDIIFKINQIIDMKISLEQNRFIVKTDFDNELDQKKNELIDITNKLHNIAKTELNYLQNSTSKKVTAEYLPETGFLLAIEPWTDVDPNPSTIENHCVRYVTQSNGKCYFRTLQTDELSKLYSSISADILTQENLYCKSLLNYFYQNIEYLEKITQKCAKFDCLMAMAAFSKIHNLTEPHITIKDKCLEIYDGRHILLEINSKCITNNTKVNVKNKNLITLINAPNATGKSVYLKQIGLIVFLAHIGCYVPAAYAKIPLIDAIYTKMYCSESISDGNSAFLSELKQMKLILLNATTKSLVLIDEFGKGTNVLEGKSLLTACIENLNARLEASPITFITTHYADIYDLLGDKQMVQIKTMQIDIKTDYGTLKPMFKIINGSFLGNYATKCPLVKDFLEEMLTKDQDSANGSSSLISYDELCEKRIDFAFKLLQIYLHNNNSIDLATVLNEIENLKF